jgi:hypothetical protein
MTIKVYAITRSTTYTLMMNERSWHWLSMKLSHCCTHHAVEWNYHIITQGTLMLNELTRRSTHWWCMKLSQGLHNDAIIANGCQYAIKYAGIMKLWHSNNMKYQIDLRGLSFVGYWLENVKECLIKIHYSKCTQWQFCNLRFFTGHRQLFIWPLLLG